MGEKLFISLRAFDGRRYHRSDDKVSMGKKTWQIPNDGIVLGGIPHHASLSDHSFAHLELGFYQGDDGGILPHKFQDTWDNDL